MRTISALNRGTLQSVPGNSVLALILAGGNGTRLADLTRWECKPALPFAGKFRNIDFSLSNCLHSGIRRMAVLTQYKSQTLIQHLDQAWSFLPRALDEFVDLWPAQQRIAADWYRGTADAVYQNLELIQTHSPRLILILAGDHVYKMDYRRLLAEHQQSGAAVTVACVPVPTTEAGGFGVMNLREDGRIASFIEKPSPAQLGAEVGDTVLGSMGVYVFNAEYLYERLTRDAQSSTSVHDFGRDLLPAAVATGDVNAFVFTNADGTPGYWRDVGTVDSYWMTHMELLDRNAGFSIYDEAWPILTQLRQLPPTQMLATRHPSVTIDSLISEGCIIDSSNVVRSVLAPGVRVGEGCSLEQTVVLPDAVIGPHCCLRRTIVESGCSIPAGSIIGANPGDDAARFTTSPEGVVLVTAEALARTVRQVA